ncbi:hypothetical protein ABZ747_17770 [Kitasatospora cineracea]
MNTLPRPAVSEPTPTAPGYETLPAGALPGAESRQRLAAAA